jgi:polyisoprenoid-binding protein YceI
MTRALRLVVGLLAFLLPGVAQAAENPSSYYVPPAQFNAALQVMDLGFANVFALFQNATASFDFDEGEKTLSHLRIAIDATSLSAGNVEAQNDLASLLGIMQYNEIRITAPDTVTFTDGKAEIKATVSLHGATKPVTFDAVLNHVGKSPRGGGMWSHGGDAAGVSLHGTFKRADFGMSDDPDVPGRFGDSMTMMLEMQALKQ